MEITFKNKRYDLSQNNFVAAGGEGAVYRHGDLAFKILHAGVALPDKNKISLLESVRRPEVNLTLGQISPAGLAYDWIDGKPLAECVTNDFWQTFSYDRAERVAETSREIVAAAHSKGFSLVDLNGGNLMLKGDTPVFIDVESWSAKGFEADYSTAKISPAIRDWREKKIGKGADWFAWAIIMFEFYVGIHPFRAGNAPGYGKKEWQKRMANGVSAFKASGLSPNCRPLDGIPANIRTWMEKVFAGDRSAPPDVKGLAGFVVQKQIIRAHSHFELILLQEYDDEILYHAFVDGKRVIKTKKMVWVDNASDTGDIATVIDGTPITIIQSGDRLVFSKILQSNVPCEKGNWGLWQGKIFSKVKGNFYWYKLGKLGSGFYVAPERTIPVYENATKVFNGFCIVDAEGRKNLVAESLYRCQELDGYKVISGRRLSVDTFIVIGEKNAELTEFTINIFGGTPTVKTREVDHATILAVSPRKNFIVQLEHDEVRLTSGNQVQTFAGTFSADFISTEGENTVVAIGKQLFQLKTK